MGPNYSISTACATSNFCILNAANHIVRGEAVSILPMSVSLEKNLAYYNTTKGHVKFHKKIERLDVM